MTQGALMAEKTEGASRESVGAVVIGRNEGPRLHACLASIVGRFDTIVYVDSGSTDDSMAIAAGFGISSVLLDSRRPFTAARARNTGFRYLRQRMPDVAHVQFLDGDCVLSSHWLDTARAVMRRAPEAAVVCGRRRERHPHASVYNWLCDREWNTPVGEARACGGDALMRVAAFEAAGGFAEDIIAGEEPDLCHRLRGAGWRVYRIASEMSVHDAAMTRFSQWWQRNRRSGHASAEALARRGRDEPRLLRQVLSNLFWASPLSLPLWPLLWARMTRRLGPRLASFTLLGKLPHAQGQLHYWLRRAPRLIEYK